MEQQKQATRIQTSLINGVEKKALIYLAGRQPKWMTSDILTAIGTTGAVIIGLGYYLTNFNQSWLWLSSFGFFVNWYGDSLDGTLARVRKQQRPVYGYYIDHTMDVINEACMFVGLGLSPYLSGHLWLALSLYIAYLLITLNVSINAHLKDEFKLTYFKLGPTEFRIIAVILNTFLVFLPMHKGIRMMTVAAFTVFALLAVIYIASVTGDIRDYAKRDPKRPNN